MEIPPVKSPIPMTNPWTVMSRNPPATSPNRGLGFRRTATKAKPLSAAPKTAMAANATLSHEVESIPTAGQVVGSFIPSFHGISVPMSGTDPRAPNRVPVEVQGLTISYGERLAVRNLSFTVRSGEIYGLLGSNGAGKTSTIKSLVGLVTPAQGTLRVFGYDPIGDGLAARERIGYVPETALLFDALTPREFLEFIVSVRRVDPTIATERVSAYARAFQIDSEFDQPIVTLSNGTRQKVMLVAAFVHQPPLLVLDEPLNNLDPRAMRIMKELLTKYVVTSGRGVLFSTHTMEIAEQLCHRVGILDHGQLQGEGTVPELRRKIERGDATLEQIFLRLTSEEQGVDEAVRSLGGS